MIETGNALEQVRGQQMIDLTNEGKISQEISELTRMVVESIVIYDDTIKISFLDGAQK